MKTALITGGSRGIGRACVQLLAQRGWQVAFCYLNNEAAANEVADATGAVAYKVDISDSNAVTGMADDLQERFGHIDLIVNNVGVASQKLFTDVTDEEWKRTFDVNVNGAFYCTRAVLPEMIRRKSGNVIFVSSMWGVSGGSCEVLYSATKAALIGMTKALAKEVGPSGIRVNCVAPGVIDTDMNSHLTESDMASLAEDTSLCRIGKADEVAKAIAFLADEESAFITGQVLGVDGGIIV